MITDKVREYRRAWKAKHIYRQRMYRLKWYYENREVINLMFSKPTSIVPDLADIYYEKTHPEG